MGMRCPHFESCYDTDQEDVLGDDDNPAAARFKRFSSVSMPLFEALEDDNLRNFR